MARLALAALAVESLNCFRGRLCLDCLCRSCCDSTPLGASPDATRISAARRHRRHSVARYFILSIVGYTLGLVLTDLALIAMHTGQASRPSHEVAAD